MGSENPTGADNQQETASSCTVLDPHWIVGFVDGEGCFCVSLHRSSMMRRHGGWQLQPVFHVYQHRDHRDILEALMPVYGCGKIRPKGLNSSVWTYAVEGLLALERCVIPFFERSPPVVKRDDFRWVRASGPHGLRHECPRQAAVQDIGASPGRILRDCTRGPLGGESRRGVKIQSDPHGDMRS